jgi:hypothetical protein
MGPFGIVGDAQGIDLPVAEFDTNLLSEERKNAKFSRTAEYKKLKEYIDNRIVFYQTCLPNGAEVGLDVAPSAEDWRVANRVIGEFKAILNKYESAAQIVKEANDQVSTS